MTQETEVPSLQEVHLLFADWAETRSRETARAYRNAVSRFLDYLRDQGLDPEATSPRELPDTVLEKFFQWLVRRYGRSTRGTTGAYLAGVRVFFRYLDRQGWGPAGVTYEQLPRRLRHAVCRGGRYP